MPNDYITIKALTNELNKALVSGKIDKVTMPEKDEVNLMIRSNNQNYALAISCNASNPRIHLTHKKKPSPIQAPAFCMHLRKYLQNGYITNIYNLNEDRIIVIEVQSKNDMRDTITYKLIAEIMGRYSNIIMLNDKDIITDALKQVPFDVMTKRALIPSAKYSIPDMPKAKLSDVETIEKSLHEYTGNSISQMLSNTVSGIAKNTAQEIIYESQVDDAKSPLDDKDIKSIIKAINIFSNISNTKLYFPCVSIVNSKPQDFYVTKYHEIKEYKAYKTINDAIDNCLATKDDIYRQKEKTKYLQKAYSAFLSKCKKKLDKTNQRLAESSEKESYRIKGELIIANIYKIKKGDKELIADNYYEENCPQIKIALDNMLSPQANAQQYYKKYNKLKHTEEVSLAQINELEETIAYLSTIEPFISRANTPQEILDIQRELENIGALKVQKQKGNKKPQEAPPIHYFYKGFDIFVGKNNLQNDKLTFKIANGGDIWLHTKAFHGSHTIIITKGNEVPVDVIQFAAEICAVYSCCDSSSKVEVDYTQRKNVKRHPNKNPGMVLYEVYKTACVTPNEHKEALISH